MIEHLRRAGLQLKAAGLYAKPTLAALAAELAAAATEVEAPPNRIPPGCERITSEMLPLVNLTSEQIELIVAGVPGGSPNVQDIYPLAPLQAGMLFHHVLAPEGDPYVLTSRFTFESRGHLERYLDALGAVVARHDILRTAFWWEGVPEPVQVVWRNAPARVEEISLTTAGEDAWQEMRRRWDPRRCRLDPRQAPLLRCLVAPDIASGHWVLLQQMHHLIVDHATMEILEQELRSHLEGRTAGLSPALPFRNFVARSRGEADLAGHEAFFRQMLGDVNQPTTPFGFTNVRGDGSGIRQANRPLTAALAGRMRERARGLGVSVASLCHVAWAQVLARLCGCEDVVFGTVLLGRMQNGGEGAPGPFLNTLPIRIPIGEEGARSKVQRAHARVGELLRHEHAPLALAQRCGAVLPPSPLFSALFNFYRRTGPGLAGKGPRAFAPGIQALGREERTNYPLMLCVEDHEDGTTLIAQVQSPMEPERILAYMETALDSLVTALEQAPEAPMRGLEVLPAVEKQQLIWGWNDTRAKDTPTPLIHQLFERQARRTPECIAIREGEVSLSYAELDRRAGRLAHWLRTQGVGAEALVGVYLDRSAALLVALLGVLKAGAAYLPLDRNLPRERLELMLREAQPRLVLCPAGSGGDALPGDAPKVKLEDAIGGNDPDARTVGGEVRPQHLAYAIFTSGSTGRPKLVGVEHGSIANLLAFATEELYRPEDVRCVPFVDLISFDSSLQQIFAPLALGGTLVVVPDAMALHDLSRAHAFSCLGTTPSVLGMLLDQGLLPDSIRCLGLGAEVIPAKLIERLRELRHVERVFNFYGPTEATVYCTVARVWDRQQAWPAHAPPRPSDLAGRVIGRPIRHTRVYVVDEAGQLAPVGVAGELWVAGAGVARAYLNSPPGTEQGFGVDPFRLDGARLYRTGDLGRRLPDGNLEFLGRKDQQVKVRGFRVEPGDVESALRTCPGVGDCVVVARQDPAGESRLAAYVVGTDPRLVPAALELREMLGRKLPRHMVPLAFVFLERLPLLPNGKLDRRALPAPEPDRAEVGPDYVAPRTPTEATLARLWAEVLNVTSVSVHDDFFARGGHSLLSVRLVVEIERAFRTKVPLAALFRLSTVAQLARFIDDGASALSEAAGGLADLSATAPSVLAPDIYRQLLAYTAGWKAQRMHPESLLFQMNSRGVCQPLFWCLQGFAELEQLAKHLGDDQPVYALRSGHQVMEYTSENVEALAGHYAGEILRADPVGPYLLGGNCQGSIIMLSIARRLQRAGKGITLLTVLEQQAGAHPPFVGPVSLLFGSESPFNPYRDFRNPELGLRKLFPQLMSIDLIPARHGHFFEEPHIQTLAELLRKSFRRAQTAAPPAWPSAPLLPEAALQVQIAVGHPGRMMAGQRTTLSVTVRNASPVAWPATRSSGVSLGNHWLSEAGERVVWCDGSAHLLDELPPGKSVELSLEILPPGKPGRYRLD